MRSRKLDHLVVIETQRRLAIRFLLGFAMFGMMLTGCTLVGPEFQQPAIPMLSTEYQTRDSLQQPAQDLDDWWRSFADPTLDQLVSQALKSNLTVQIAAERIIEARANVNLKGRSLLPTTDLLSSYEYRKRSPNARPFVGQNGNPFQLFNLGLDSSWEIDLFGRLERSIQAAEAELVAQEFSLQDVHQTLVADVATSYLSIRLLQDQIHTVEKSLELQQETTTVVNSRSKAGVATKLDSEQTDAFLHRTRATMAALELQLDVEFNRLSILLGESPAMPIRDFVGFGPIPDAPYLPAAGIPADLLRRRPDVRQAEAVVRAATARIGVAEADLYPTLSLLGNIGVSSQNVSSLFQTDSLLFNVGPSFRWNILNIGRIRNNIEIHESLMRQAAGGYRVAVLNAVQEVEDSMARYDGYRKQVDALESAVESDANAIGLSLQRYELGKSNFQRVLDVQMQLLQDAQAVATARANANIQLIKLYKSVGGGWPGPLAVTGSSCGCACTECASGNQGGCLAGVQPVQLSEIQDFTYDESQGQSATQFPTILSSEVVSPATSGFGDYGHSEDFGNQLEDLQTDGATILNVEPMQPADSKIVLPRTGIPGALPGDFGPIELPLNLDQTRQIQNQPTGKKVLAEMFDWDASDAAVVKSLDQRRSSLSSNATAGYFTEVPKDDNKQNTQKASTIGAAPMVWDSQSVKVD
ncbi:TolC family protein [Mariniblastus sp.]|nr:TolC family protein [Mariniblastus sp.]